jgi:ATP-dependent RNA helicase DDX21
LQKIQGTANWKDPAILSTNNTRWVNAGMDQAVIDVLSSKGISSFTPVQAEAFEPIMQRRDVIGRSRTGTGKTLAFGMPCLQRLVKFHEMKGNRDNLGRMKRGRAVSMVVLCPTRELARQVADEIATVVAQPLGLAVEVFHGGVSYGPQANAIRDGLDVLVGTPGRVMDHLEKGNLDLSECDIVVLDEADEMLNMGFADDVEFILKGVGSKNEKKTQCLLFSATTPPWVKQIGRQYQENVLSIDSTTDEGGARVAKTVRHTAIQLPPGDASKLAVLEDIIAVEISRDKSIEDDVEEKKITIDDNPIAAAALEKKRKSQNTMQQKIFGKTIVFTETKRLADELVSGSVFKSLTAQALHGDVGQQQRDATLNAFRAGAFNVLVATDVAARGIDIKDVDLVIQFDPPRDVDTYVHRSGRTGRAGKKGVSVLLFNRNQSRDIVRIERDLGHGFKFDLIGPPSTDAALSAAAKTSAIACKGIPEETAAFFEESAAALLEEFENPQDVVARCLAAISRRSTDVQSRSLLTGEVGFATVEVKNVNGRPLSSNDVVFTINKLARMSEKDDSTEYTFDGSIGRVQTGDTNAFFDMPVDNAKKLIEFSKNVDAGGHVFSLLKEMEIDRDADFGDSGRNERGYGRSRGGGGGGGGYGRGGGGGGDRFGRSSGGGGDRFGSRSSGRGGDDRRRNDGGGGGGGRYGGFSGDRNGGGSRDRNSGGSRRDDEWDGRYSKPESRGGDRYSVGGSHDKYGAKFGNDAGRRR